MLCFKDKFYTTYIIIGYFACASVAVACPEDVSENETSPDGRYSVVKELKKIKGQDYPERRLFLAESASKKRIPLKLFGGNNLINRDVEIRWSPKSDLLTVNDLLGSNVANAYLYRMTDPQHPLNAQKRLQKIISGNSKPEMHDLIHVYVTATKWKTESIVEVRVAEDYQLSDDRKKLPLEQIPIESRTTYYDWDTLHNSLKRTKQTSTINLSDGNQELSSGAHSILTLSVL